MARKRFGRRNATKKASAAGPAPRIAASTISRAKPVMRDSSVSPPTVRIRSIIGVPGADVNMPKLNGLKSATIAVVTSSELP